MNSLNMASDQETSQIVIGARTYVNFDNIVKYCRTAPLLELPVDFKEWYNPNGHQIPTLTDHFALVNNTVTLM